MQNIGKAILADALLFAIGWGEVIGGIVGLYGFSYAALSPAYNIPVIKIVFLLCLSVFVLLHGIYILNNEHRTQTEKMQNIIRESVRNSIYK